MRNITRKYKIISLLIIYFCLFFSIGIINTNAIEIKIVSQKEYDINREEVFEFYTSFFEGKIPESYKYINLNFKDVKKEDSLYSNLQKLVYLDLIKNSESNIYGTKNIDAYTFYKLSEKIFEIDIIVKDEIKELKERETNINDLNKIKNIINNKELKISNDDFYNSKKEIETKKAIFSDVYSTLLNEHYDKENIKEENIIDSAIEGLTKGTEDKHTVYFPPTETKDFYESLNGEYEGIGAYVDMETPGVIKIVSPITGTPSQKSGLKGGDIILKVDGKEVTKDNSLNEVVSWIKGPKGTIVILTIKRDTETLEISVIRDKIIIKEVEYNKISYDTYYINIKSFGGNVSSEFEKALTELKKEEKVKRIIIDLRNNGGGYLGEVTNMLSYFVKKGEPTAVVKYLDNTEKMYSKGNELIDFSKYKIIILQNSGTASASEIMIGTIKDYYPNVEIIGEKSYGKGSVQTIKTYSDGSTLKYTVAKWFTGKNEIGIDGVGISPTIELEFDQEKYKNENYDNQLEKAKSLR